jgi:hypothetical protein
MSDPGNKAANKKKRRRKTCGLNFENLRALLLVKGERVSARRLSMCMSRIEPQKQRCFEKIIDQGSNGTLNHKQRKMCDLNFENFSASVSVEADCFPA